MKVLIYGLGRSGRAAAKLAHKQGHQIYYYDIKPNNEDLKLMAKLAAIRVENIRNSSIDICIAAPGVPYSHRDLIYLRKNDVETIGEVEWVYRTVNSKIIAITGTAGKGSITRWATQILNSANIAAVAGGNIEPALADVARDNLISVVEMSSFQLERCPSLKPHTAVIANLDVDHLDYHGSIESYHAAKKNILKNLDTKSLFIFNQDDDKLSKWASQSIARTQGFSLKTKADAYLENNSLFLFGKKLIDISELQFTAKHFLANALATSLVAFEEGLTSKQIANSLRELEPETGRYSVIAEKDNIVYIEDSIATRSLAVRAGLESSRAPIVWIAGGVNKGAEFESLKDLVANKVELMITIGQSAQEFSDEFSGFCETVVCNQKDGKEALKSALKIARARLEQTGGSILLAPLAASFDQFKDYKERGKIFRELVGEISNG